MPLAEVSRQTQPCHPFRMSLADKANHKTQLNHPFRMPLAEANHQSQLGLSRILLAEANHKTQLGHPSRMSLTELIINHNPTIRLRCH
jgi:hypothetical protein